MRLRTIIHQLKFEIMEHVDRVRQAYRGWSIYMELVERLIKVTDITRDPYIAMERLRDIVANKESADEYVAWAHRQIDEQNQCLYEIMTTLASALGLAELPGSTGGSDGLVPAALAQQAAAEIKRLKDLAATLEQEVADGLKRLAQWKLMAESQERNALTEKEKYDTLRGRQSDLARLLVRGIENESMTRRAKEFGDIVQVAIEEIHHYKRATKCWAAKQKQDGRRCGGCGGCRSEKLKGMTNYCGGSAWIAPEYAGKPLDCGLCDGKYDHADNCPGVDGASREVHQCPNPNALLCLCPDKAGQ